MVDRPVFTYKDRTQHFDISGYSKTYGDVIGIYPNGHPNNRIAFLADSTGHIPTYGRKVRHFFDYAIKRGWGKSENPLNDTKLLYELLPKTKKLPWMTFACSLLHIESEQICLMNHGNPYPLKITNSGVEKIKTSGSYLDLMKIVPSSPIYISFDIGNILFLSSDGIQDNLEFKTKNGLEQLTDSLFKNQNLSAKKIVDKIISEFGEYIIPKTQKDDDTSFLIIKRHN